MTTNTKIDQWVGIVLSMTFLGMASCGVVDDDRETLDGEATSADVSAVLVPGHRAALPGSPSTGEAGSGPRAADTTDVQTLGAECIVGASGTCTTGVVAAGASHVLLMIIDNSSQLSPCSFRLRDVVNGQIFGGTVGPRRRSETLLSGAFSLYQLTLFSCRPGARGVLDDMGIRPT